MSRRQIINADKVAGPCNMRYDQELSGFESAERHALIGGYATFPLQTQYMPFSTVISPVEVERKSDKYLAEALAIIS